MARLAIRMPKMSMTMTEGDVASWTISVGDTIAVGDVVAEVMTDKVDMEVESPVAGTLVEIVHETGTVEVGAPIGWVEGDDEGGSFGDLLAEPDAEPADATPDAEPGAQPPAGVQTGDEPVLGPDDATGPEASEDVRQRAPEPEPQTAQAESSEPGPDPARAPAERDETTVTTPAADGDTRASQARPPAAVPRARGLAQERGVDLADVRGTGPDGLIRVVDVEALLSSPAPATAAQPRTESGPADAGAGQVAAADRRAVIRAAVARKMSPSAAIPQFTVWREIELDAADTIRRGLSWTTMLLRAYAAALRDVPDLLCRWEGDQATDSGPPAVALAVATDRGLLVPTFDEPDRTDPRELDQEMRDVVRAAQSGKLDRTYLGPANGSLSNLGGLGVDRFQALLTPPQASVLALGSVRPRPVAVPGGVGLALTVWAGVTVDHRVADGAQAARLLQGVATHVARPLT